MRHLNFLNDTTVSHILCIGAHCDDIEIGCGGTILKLLEGNSNISFTWVVFCSNEKRGGEAIESAQAFLSTAKEKNITLNKFRDGFLPYSGYEVKDQFEKLKQTVNPDLIFTPYRNDLHQDHRLVSELTWNTFRDHLIMEYEIPKYDGDLGSPNVFVHIDHSTCQRKIKHVLDCYESQKSKKWFTEDLFLSLFRIRGMESNSPSNYAEAFYYRKMVLSF